MAEPRAKLSRTALRWALVGFVCQHLPVARLADLGLYPDTDAPTASPRHRVCCTDR